MDGNYKQYSYTNSSDRIKNILDQPTSAFEEVDALPNREKLTYSNGFYGWCSAIYIDIRESSKLTEKHKRPTLAKLYRAFISEMVAVLNSNPEVREVNIVGDCVWAVYNTPKKTDIDEIFSVASKANTLLKLLNHHYTKKDITPIKAGIGVDYGRVLMVKAGFNGSTIDDVIYMGDVVNRAAHLANEAGRRGVHPIFIGGTFHQNLNQHNQNHMGSRHVSGLGTIYAGNIVNTLMNDWVKKLK